MSHTPGPWSWSFDYTTSDGRKTFSLVCDQYEYGILSCDGEENSPQCLGPQGEADARLIAAAPELLDALQQFVQACKKQGIKLGAITGLAEHVIAKATGQ